MAIAIKSTAAIAEKWARVTPARSKDYADGVAAPRRDWQSTTEAAEQAWQQGIQNSIANKSRLKGVRKRGTSGWQTKTLEKGTVRWGPGVSGAKDDYFKGVDPYLQTIAALTLPPKGPKGDPRNIDRVAKIAMALHERKLKG